MRLRIRLRPKERGEQGAMAIMAALFTMLALVLATLSVDLAEQVRDRHQLQDAVEVAARTAAADLPFDTSDIRIRSTALAQVTDGQVKDATLCDPANPTSGCLEYRFFCVVHSAPNPSGAGFVPDGVEFGVLCKTTGTRVPGGADATVTCNDRVCAIRCQPTLGDTCNTVQVRAFKDVEPIFTRLFGMFDSEHETKSSTGWVGTGAAACKGACGGAPNPMDIVVVTDRTLSMKYLNAKAMVDGLTKPGTSTTAPGMLGQMTPAQQYLALGTIGPARTSPPAACRSKNNGNTLSSGNWITSPFTQDYRNASTGAINTGSQIVKDINCLISNPGGTITANTDNPEGSGNTALAAPFKAAARYVLGYDVGGTANNLSSLPDRSQYGDPRKVIIFETDGQPSGEPTGDAASLLPAALSLGNSTLPFANLGGTTTVQDPGQPVAGTPSTPVVTNASLRSGTGGPFQDKYSTVSVTSTTSSTRTPSGANKGCENFAQVAQNAKALGILVITIGFAQDGIDCEGRTTQRADTSSNGTATTKIVSSTIVVGGVPTTGTTCLTGTAGNYTYNSPTCTYRGIVTVNRVTTTPVAVTHYARALDANTVLAGAASNRDDGTLSDPGVCGTAAGALLENTDKDYFFCTSDGDDFAKIFKTALAQAQTGVKTVQLPDGS